MRTKKSLGQHFLTSNAIAKNIVNVAAITKDDVVLEIGPGKGMLTHMLLDAKPAAVIAVEKDRELVSFLKEEFSNFIKEGKLVLIEGDALLTPFSSIKPAPSKVVANIPYNITGKLLRHFFSTKSRPEKIVLMVQREVAKRIVANDKKESILSISVKAYGIPKYIDTVSARFFKPKPKVSSAIISVENISDGFFRDINENVFFEIVRVGFSQKRKLLINNLKKFTDAEKLRQIFAACGIEEKVRAEDVGLSDWKCLVEKLK